MTAPLATLPQANTDWWSAIENTLPPVCEWTRDFDARDRCDASAEWALTLRCDEHGSKRHLLCDPHKQRLERAVRRLLLPGASCRFAITDLERL